MLRLTDPLSIPDLLARHPARRGSATLRAITPHATITRSELEDAFLSFTERFDLPRPRTNANLHGQEVDCVWPGRRLVVELDGHATHSTRAAFERDRERDRILVTHGWRVVRVTWRQLRDGPRALAADLRRLLVA